MGEPTYLVALIIIPFALCFIPQIRNFTKDAFKHVLNKFLCIKNTNAENAADFALRMKEASKAFLDMAEFNGDVGLQNVEISSKNLRLLKSRSKGTKEEKIAQLDRRVVVVTDDAFDFAQEVNKYVNFICDEIIERYSKSRKNLSSENMLAFQEIVNKPTEYNAIVNSIFKVCKEIESQEETVKLSEQKYKQAVDHLQCLLKKKKSKTHNAVKQEQQAEQELNDDKSRLESLKAELEVLFDRTEIFEDYVPEDNLPPGFLNSLDKVPDAENCPVYDTKNSNGIKIAKNYYNKIYKSTSSDDIRWNAHMPTIMSYARECQSILEIGTVFAGMAISGMIGLYNGKQENPSYTAFFFSIPKFPFSDWINHTSSLLGIKLSVTNYSFQNVPDESEKYDMLYLAPIRTYAHYIEALDKYSPHVTKFIVIYLGEGSNYSQTCEDYSGDFSEFPQTVDTSKTGIQTALTEFVEKYKGQWEEETSFSHCGGLIVFRRVI